MATVSNRETTIVSLVTYRRPEWAVEIIRRCLEEPDCEVWVTSNCDGFTSGHEESCGGGDRLRVWRPGKNLGAGGGRNLHLRDRPLGVPFLRLDDDVLMVRPGWLSRLHKVRMWNRAAVVRISTDVEEGCFYPRRPHANGSYLVSGECADALGGFYLGFGGTVLDDVEYSFRAAVWAREGCSGGIFEYGEPYEDLCRSRAGGIGGGWLVPEGLFTERASELLSGMSPLFVPYDSPRRPGWVQRDAGLPDREREFDW